MPFPILYQDEDLVAIKLSDGILVHRNPISRYDMQGLFARLGWQDGFTG